MYNIKNSKGGEAVDILSTRLRDLRTNKDLKQSQVADALSIGRSTMSNYENGRDIPPEMIAKYADFFKVSADYLLGLTNEPLPKNADTVKPFQKLSVADPYAFTLSDVLELVDAFTEYCQAGAPAGEAPMRCMRRVMDAMCKVLSSASRHNIAQLLLAVNELASCCLQGNDMLKTYLLKEEPK